MTEIKTGKDSSVSIWKKGWLKEVLDAAEKEVQSWPEWMRQPELRYPLDRHKLKQGK